MSKVMLIASRAESIPYRDECDYIGVDKGAYIALQANIPLVCAIGDFDSITLEQREMLKAYTNLITLPERKNETDSEAAVHYALSKGYDDITLYGGFGGRIDHTMANMYLLMHRDYPLTLEDEQNKVQLLTPGKYTIPNNFRHLSLLALEPSVISETGVSYPLVERAIDRDDIYTISNHILHHEAEITIHSGKVLCLQSNAQ